jgi:hypothetical protein
MPVLLPYHVDETHLRIGHMKPFGLLLQLHVMIAAIADTLLPPSVRVSGEAAGVDEIQHFAGHRPVPYGEVVPSDDRNAPLVERQPIQEL